MAKMSDEHRADLERQKQEAQKVYDKRTEAPASANLTSIDTN